MLAFLKLHYFGSVLVGPSGWAALASQMTSMVEPRTALVAPSIGVASALPKEVAADTRKGSQGTDKDELSVTAKEPPNNKAALGEV